MAILDGKLDVTTQEGYDIACALRGPDIQGLRYLKQVLVIRLRALVGVESHIPDSATIKKAATEWQQFQKWIDQEDSEVRNCLKDALWHWIGHLVGAYRALIKIERTEELSLLYEVTQALTWSGLDPDRIVKSLEAYEDYIKEQQGDSL